VGSGVVLEFKPQYHNNNNKNVISSFITKASFYYKCIVLFGLSYENKDKRTGFFPGCYMIVLSSWASIFFSRGWVGLGALFFWF
jgi:hypothetical protein